MVLARSIRRKLIVGLALVLVMMATLSISGLGGLWSYRQAVRELNFLSLIHISEPTRPY